MLKWGLRDDRTTGRPQKQKTEGRKLKFAKANAEMLKGEIKRRNEKAETLKQELLTTGRRDYAL